MTIVLTAVRTDDLGPVCAALGEWQREGGPVQLHPGDVGWQWRNGPAATADVLFAWRRHGELVAVGMLDDGTVLRLAVPRAMSDDGELARAVAHDLTGAGRLLPAEPEAVEARAFAALDGQLAADGWRAGESWTPLHRDLGGAIESPDIHVDTVTSQLVADRTAVHRAGFESPAFTDERWHDMAAGPFYADARCLVAYDGENAPVAAITVWASGAGRPGLIEPMSVHPAHRRRGYGRAITIAGAAALRAMGASSATVCAPTANVAAVATYESAGFTRLPESRDRSRVG